MSAPLAVRAHLKITPGPPLHQKPLAEHANAPEGWLRGGLPRKNPLARARQGGYTSSSGARLTSGADIPVVILRLIRGNLVFLSVRVAPDCGGAGAKVCSQRLNPQSGRQKQPTRCRQSVDGEIVLIGSTALTACKDTRSGAALAAPARVGLGGQGSVV